MTTLEILKKARAMMAKPYGWSNGSLEEVNGAVCAVGALSKVATGMADYAASPECVEAEKLLSDIVGENIVGYNDSHSKKCVLAAFSSAIREIKEEEKTCNA